MGNRSECPACKAYSSDVYNALHFVNKNCPFCDCPHELLVLWDDAQEQIEKAKDTKISRDIIKKNEELFQENAKLKTKISKMENILLWKDVEELFSPFFEIKKILENEI